MLKTRILPTLLFKDVGLVKGVGFDSWRRIGLAMQAIKVYNMRDVDELVFFDITATPDERRPDFEQIQDLAAECYMPMTVGGGVRTLEDIRDLLKVGADKIAINTAAIQIPELITEGAAHFGSQCIVVPIDVKRTLERWEVYSHCGTRPTGLDPVTHAQNMEKLGAGEIILTSIDLDGTMEGYDLEITKRVASAVSIPVVAAGGAGNYEHMREAIQDGKASAVAAASIFHFTEQTPKEARDYLRANGIPTRK